VPLLVKGHNPLVVNVSSPGAIVYMHSVPYGVGKAAVDKLTNDTAHELRDEGVAVVSIWPGIVYTEWVAMAPRNAEGRQVFELPGEAIYDLADAESPRFSGRAVVALHSAADRLERSGKAFIVADLADAYGFTDVDGRVPRTPLPSAGIS